MTNRRVIELINDMSYEMKIAVRGFVLCNFDAMRNAILKSSTESVTFSKDNWQFNLNSVEELEQLLRGLI